VNHTEWQALAVLVAALAFVGAATAVQRLLGRAAARLDATARAAARSRRRRGLSSLLPILKFHWARAPDTTLASRPVAHRSARAARRHPSRADVPGNS
jgi:hypothetical protein